MIQFSFSPNWYRSQCMSFSQHGSCFYYSSNCILYKYDMKSKGIVSQLNLKHFLYKIQGYSQPQSSKQSRNAQTTKGFQKDLNKKEGLSQKQQIDKERILKISAIQLIQIKGSDLLVVGFNCLGLIAIVQVEQDHSMSVKQVVDVSKADSQFVETQYIYLCNEETSLEQIKKVDEKQVYKSVFYRIMVFSTNMVQLSVQIQINIRKQQSKSAISQLQINLINHPSQSAEKQRKPNQNQNEGSLISSTLNTNNQKQRISSGQIKLISKQQLQTAKATKEHFQQQNNNNTAQGKFFYHIAFFSTRFVKSPQSTSNNSRINKNIVIFNHDLSQLLAESSLEEVVQRRQTVKRNNSCDPMESSIDKYKDSKSFSSTIMSLDYIGVGRSSNIEGKNPSMECNKYIVLSKVNNNEKPNIFCQKYDLTCFYSGLFEVLLTDKDSSNQIKQIDTQSISKIKVEIIYPKKCHFKLSQQQKSTLSVKFINPQTLLLSGKLGQMFIIDLKQIQLKLQKSQKQYFILSLKPYSYQDQKNKFWLLQPSQRHYKDVYAIYRIQNQGKSLQSCEYMNSPSITQKQNCSSNLYLVGTDHILTQWKIAQEQNSKPTSLQQRLTYLSNIKFLTSSIEQIVFSQPQPSLVFLRLKDSNIRSFEPFSDRGYWLNQFWKHSSHSFLKRIQRLVMHTTQIGIACMVTEQSKIVIYDIYEQRLIKLIEIREKFKPKVEIDKQNGKAQLSKKNLYDNKNKHSNSSTSETRQLQINSISFEHISIIKTLQSLYGLQNLLQVNFSQEAIKEKFQTQFQSFYQRQMDSSVILMIQSNEFLILIKDLGQQLQQKNIMVFKKLYKLQRINKTKYWNGSLLVGTRKKKGQLQIGITLMKFLKESLKEKLSGEYYLSLEKQIHLPIGASSRYLFKLAQVPDGLKCNKQTKSYTLCVISYKGSKLGISIFMITHVIEIKPSNYLQNQQNSSIQNKQIHPLPHKTDELTIKQLFRSEQIQLPYLNGQNNAGIMIEHLIVSQQQDEYLIGIYNNQLQTISFVDFRKLVQKSIDEHNNQVEENQQPIICQLQSQSKNQKPKNENSSIGEISQNEIDHKRQSCCQDQLNKNLISSNPTETMRLQTSTQKSSIKSQVQTKDHPIIIHQMSCLPYKIESISFHKSSQENFSHLLILGKDQSVRLLQLSPFIGQQNDFGRTNVILSRKNEGQKRIKYSKLFKYQSKVLMVQPQKTHEKQKQSQSL